MYRQKLITLLLLAGLAGAADLSFIKNTARHCPQKDQCLATVEIRSINSADKALNDYADKILREAGPQRLDQAGLEAWLQKNADADGGDDGEATPGFFFEVEPLGETAHYRVLQFSKHVPDDTLRGMDYATFHVLPKEGELKPLPLAEILLPNQRAQLDELQKQNLVAGMEKKQAEEYLKSYDFKAGDNWRPDAKGLIFSYDTSEIAPQAQGPQEILVPKEQLKDIVRPEFLKELDSWQKFEWDKSMGEPVLKKEWRS